MEHDLTQQTIENLRGKHIKQILTRLERNNTATKDTRKIVLDEVNDLVRDILRALGYDVED